MIAIRVRATVSPSRSNLTLRAAAPSFSCPSRRLFQLRPLRHPLPVAFTLSPKYMQVTSATSSTAASADTTSTTTPTAKKKVMGQEDFLKLLAVQFQHQDPMKPMEDTAFIAQMAQFTALDQSSSMLTQMKSLGATQDVATANSYIGRHVTLDAGDNKTVSGDVSGVDMTSGTPRLIIGDYTYPFSSVLLVEPGTATPTQPVNSGT